MKLPLPNDTPFGLADHLPPIVALVAFRSQFEYLIRDAELEGRNLTELAFEHLRRLIAVDTPVQAKWKAAFDHNETACERLGAVHLLSHGIWAFKVTGAGVATDLVFAEPLDGEAMIVKRTARALVLTEWKRVTNPADLRRKAEEGRKQTDAYQNGVVGDTELKHTRYTVLVTEQNQESPADILDRGIIYRHICVPVAPSGPLREVRRPTAARSARKN